MNILRRHRNFGEQCFVRHPIIAVNVVGRDGAFVAPEKMHARPIDLRRKFRRGKQGVQIAGGRAAGQRDGKFSIDVDRIARERNKTPRGVSRQRGTVGENYDF